MRGTLLPVPSRPTRGMRRRIEGRLLLVVVDVVVDVVAAFIVTVKWLLLCMGAVL